MCASDARLTSFRGFRIVSTANSNKETGEDNDLVRKRIYEIAKELGTTSKDLIARLEELGMPGLKAANSVDDDEHALIVHMYEEQGSPEASAADEPAEKDEEPEAASAAASAAQKTSETGLSRSASGAPRAPIVSVLGHIDHGKTTLLDAIRKSRVVDQEAGGITQGIAAYQADLRGQKITFIDTPGHKAFTGMRARGAQATDVAVLVVAADDGVMAQTVEAIEHIRAAGIPMVVAINKIDKANANVDKVLSDLAQHGLTPEAWGGDTITVELSALQNQNIDDLLEMLLLVGEMADLRADPKAPLEAIVIESHLSASRGPVSTVVVKNGTLQEKDWIVAGSTYGRIKALTDGVGNRVEKVLPGNAAEVLGLNEVPEVGEQLEVAKNQAKAKKAAESKRQEAAKPRQVRRPMTLEEMLQESEEDVTTLQVILRAGSSGALEAARREMEGLSVKDVELSILLAGVGGVSESDILLASTVGEDALVVGFGVKTDPKARKIAETDGIPILSYDIIYDLIDEIEKALKRRLAPEFVEVKLGTAEVRDLFKVPAGVVAGCYVLEGKVVRRGQIRVLRNDVEVFVGEIASLRRFEDDVREVQADRECGIRIKEFDDVQVGDRLDVFELEEVIA